MIITGAISVRGAARTSSEEFCLQGRGIGEGRDRDGRAESEDDRRRGDEAY